MRSSEGGRGRWGRQVSTGQTGWVFFIFSFWNLFSPVGNPLWSQLFTWDSMGPFVSTYTVPYFYNMCFPILLLVL
jgi:hypothetical protein